MSDNKIIIENKEYEINELPQGVQQRIIILKSFENDLKDAKKAQEKAIMEVYKCESAIRQVSLEILSEVKKMEEAKPE